ncbi:MAG: sigma-70 family RNA polymerase sigma factor [Saprospiraceae bacterium]|nr:sigma-70 family RNA polymerase sigma factor [Saprospiraceae bacterium]
MHTPTSELNDERIIDSVLAGDIDRFEEILKRYNSVMYRVGISYLKNTADAEDAMQSAYIKAYLNLSSFRGTASFKTWIISIMINECKMMIRSKRSSWNILQIFQRKQQQTNYYLSHDHNVVTSELKKVLENVVLQLPSKYRLVYIMREIDGMSVNETAELLNITPDNVKVRSHRAKELVRKEIMQLNHNNQLFDYHLDRCNPFRARVMSEIRKAGNPAVKD